jgi:VanZ family protein
MFAVAFSAVYAVTDEIHQIFVPGRAAQFSDFVVDTSGAMFGACAALILSLMYISVLRFIKKRKNKKQKEKCS